MIVNKNAKRTFKVFLNSASTNSRYPVDGTNLYNSNYPIDLTHIIFTEEDFDKNYLMYCDFVSCAEMANVGATQPSTMNIYTLHIDFGKGLNIYQYNQSKNPSFIIPVENIVEVNAVPTTMNMSRFNLTSDRQEPVLVQNIRNLNVVNLNMLIASTPGAVNTSYVGTTGVNYICVLTFIEA